jgi:integrase/recombinase XerD
MTDEAISPLRRRMIEDMSIRKFAPKTSMTMSRGSKNFAAFLGRSPIRLYWKTCPPDRRSLS